MVQGEAPGELGYCSVLPAGQATSPLSYTLRSSDTQSVEDEQRVGTSGHDDQGMQGRQSDHPSPPGPSRKEGAELERMPTFGTRAQGSVVRAVMAAVLQGGTSTQVSDPGAICPHECPYCA